MIDQSRLQPHYVINICRSLMQGYTSIDECMYVLYCLIVLRNKIVYVGAPKNALLYTIKNKVLKSEIKMHTNDFNENLGGETF